MNTQNFSGVSHQLISQVRVIVELHTVTGDELLQVGLPTSNLGGEALRQQVQHNRSHSRSTGGSAQQSRNGAVRCRNNLGTELQDAALLRVLLHNLDALTRLDKLPLVADSLGVVLVQGLQASVLVLQQLGEQVLDQGDVIQTCTGHGVQVVQA